MSLAYGLVPPIAVNVGAMRIDYKNMRRAIVVDCLAVNFNIPVVELLAYK